MSFAFRKFSISSNFDCFTGMHVLWFSFFIILCFLYLIFYFLILPSLRGDLPPSPEGAEWCSCINMLKTGRIKNMTKSMCFGILQHEILTFTLF